MAITSAEEWQAVRDKGLSNFVLRTGVLGRGLPLGVVVAVCIEVVIGHPIPEALATWGFVGRLLMAVGVFSISGSISARAYWRSYERRFGGDGDA